MATCKLCYATIPEDEVYCETCSDKKHEKTNESYLDDLLRQVMSYDDVQVTPNKRNFTNQKADNTNEKLIELSKGIYNSHNLIDDLNENDTADLFIDELSSANLDIDISDDTELSLLMDTKQEPLGEDLDNLLGGLQQNMDVNKMNNKNFDGDVIDATRTADEEQDIMELLNLMNDNNDVFAIDDYMNGQEELPEVEDLVEEQNIFGDLSLDSFLSESKPEVTNTPTDVGNVFNDALGAVSYLEDPAIDEELLKLIRDVDDEPVIEEDRNQGKNTQNKNSHSKEETRSNKKKINLMRRVFGNVQEERSEEEIERLKQEVIKAAEEKEKLEAEAKEKKEKDKLEKKKKAADKVANKNAAKKKKQEIQKAKKDEKARKALEIQNLIDEIDEDEGRINRIGASIVFVVFAIAAVAIVIGTNIYTYSISIENATKNFNSQRYNEAYNNVYGMDIKNEDIEIYDKIMTVMFVNKQLNSYNNYYAMNKLPEALDSLLKGLERYDKYISLAKMLGIESDLDYVRDQIINELDSEFELSEKEAIYLLNIKDQAEYSIQVYDVVLERTNTKFTKE